MSLEKMEDIKSGERENEYLKIKYFLCSIINGLLSFQQ